MRNYKPETLKVSGDATDLSAWILKSGVLALSQHRHEYNQGETREEVYLNREQAITLRDWLTKTIESDALK